MYCWMHVLAVATIIFFTLDPLQKSRSRSKDKQNDVTGTNVNKVIKDVNHDVTQHTKAG